MTHRILITALYGSSERSSPSYFCVKDAAGKTLYCEALTPAEAGCKLILSSCPMDEIIVTGSAAGPTDEQAPVVLREGKEFLSPNLDGVSEYGLLQYRLAQFFEDINAEQADMNSLLDAQEQEKATRFLQTYFHERVNLDGKKKISRFFHYLMSDASLWEDFSATLRDMLSSPAENFERFRSWSLQYLYRQMKDTSKLEPLEENEDLRIRFLPDGGEVALSFHTSLLTVLREMEVDDGSPDSTELYICIQDDHGADMFSLLNAMNLIKVMPKAQIRVCRIIAEKLSEGTPVRELCDKYEDYGISELLAGTGAFLSYGKTDILVEYWKRAKLNNTTVERILYAMRNIDNGISLCDIADIERGVKTLRSVIKNDLPIQGETKTEQYFQIAMESIRDDYGPLLQDDTIPFIDLVKWAYRKGFWQQTLTLIESRAPNDFVDQGFFYYSDGERSRKQALEVFAQAYNELKPYEKYKIERDLSHYFIKYVNRQKAPRSKNGDAYQMGYAAVRIAEMSTYDHRQIRSLSICDDHEALQDLLFSYYHISDIRNLTNHAQEEFTGFYAIMEDADAGTRMQTISKAVDFFIHCYDRVCELTKGKTAHVVKLETSEVSSYAGKLRDEQYKDKHKSGDAGKGAEDGKPAGGQKTPSAESAAQQTPVQENKESGKVTE